MWDYAYHKHHDLSVGTECLVYVVFPYATLLGLAVFRRGRDKQPPSEGNGYFANQST